MGALEIAGFLSYLPMQREAAAIFTSRCFSARWPKPCAAAVAASIARGRRFPADAHLPLVTQERGMGILDDTRTQILIEAAESELLRRAVALSSA